MAPYPTHPEQCSQLTCSIRQPDREASRLTESVGGPPSEAPPAGASCAIPAARRFCRLSTTACWLLDAAGGLRGARSSLGRVGTGRVR
eukprot:356177-Chlamydomonas_euryale.AAC.6